MPKDIPACPLIPKLTREADHEFEVQLITPMFGGGVEARVNDPGCPIRATGVRGQLQFWWRATYGARCPTAEELRSAQTKVWGSTERASRVTVAVDRVETDAPAPCARFRWDPNASRGRGRWQTDWQPPFGGKNSALPYVLFPFQGEAPPPRRDANVEVEPASCIRQGKFRLTIRCLDDLWPQVEAAIWAWSNFGGVGGRTRRGCGAVLCKDFAPPSADRFPDWLSASLKNYGLGLTAQAVEWSQLAEGVWYFPAADAIITAWDRVIWTFRQFRQGENVGRNPGSPRPGRSRFPEPESIRRYASGADRGISGHARLPAIPDDAFPRAELGLPIVFHFQGKGEPGPGDTTLYPVVGRKREQRMGSPLVLRPVATRDGKAVATILRLRTPELTSVELTGHPVATPAVFPASSIRRPNLASYPNSPLGASSGGSALEAFLAFAQNADNKFRKV